MRFLAVLNRHGGTLATMDMDALRQSLHEKLSGAGHTVDIEIVESEGIVKALEKAAHSQVHDVILAAGGDGTISAAAGLLMDSDKALAVLPAGTMNLFARSLDIPLGIEEAIAALASGRPRRVDIASANGRPFVHQFSIGMHPDTIERRERMRFGSRLGKMGASARAGLATFMRPPRLQIALSMGETEILATTSNISVTNNLYGEGHLPYAEKPDGGVLGIYVTRARRRRDLLVFFLNMAIGRWRRNDQVEIHQADAVAIRMRSRHRGFKCAIDGELCPLQEETTIRLHKGALKVLAPHEQGDTVR